MTDSTTAAQHLTPVALHNPRDMLEGPEVPGNAIVGVVTAQVPVQIVNLLPDRQVAHSSHQVA